MEGSEDIPLILESIFNGLLGTPISQTIKLDRAHRALRPKGASTQPREIICFVHVFALTEHIIAKARVQRDITFAGASI